MMNNTKKQNKTKNQQQTNNQTKNKNHIYRRSADVIICIGNEGM